MLNKKEINSLSNKLGWSVKETKVALKELYQSNSIIDRDSFLRICLEAKNPLNRFERITNYLLKTLNRDFVNTICRLAYIDSCFHALALFNLIDLKKVFGDPYHHQNRSFINWIHPESILDETEFEDVIKKLRKNKSSKTIKIANMDPEQAGVVFTQELFPEPLTYRFLDKFIQVKIENTEEEPEQEWELLKELMLKVVTKIKFLAFNIPTFRAVATYNALNQPVDKNFYYKLCESFKNPLSEKEKSTEQSYWLIYALVESLRGIGYGGMASFRKAASLLKIEKVDTVERRYFQMKKKAKEQDTIVEDIINQYNLREVINELVSQSIKLKQQ